MENAEKSKYVPGLSELNLTELQERELVPFSFWDGQGWHNWANFSGRWVNLQAPAFDGLYLAAKPALPEDLDFSFINILFQRATWRQLVRLAGELTYHMRTFATSAAKIEHYFRARRDLGEACLRFVETEVERLFISVRRGYDLLQECISRIYSKARPSSKKLKNSFASIVLSGNRSLDGDAIATRFQLPRKLAEAYARHAESFQLIRDRRDKIVHGLHNGFYLGITGRGFTVDPIESDIHSFAAWSEKFRSDDCHYSLKPLLAVIVLSLVQAADDLMGALAECLELPPALAPKHSFYLRTPDAASLKRLLNAAANEEVWWE